MALLVALIALTVYVPADLSKIPPMMILVVSLFIGAAVSAVLGIAENVKLGGEIKKLKKELKESEAKIQKLQLDIRGFEEKEEKIQHQTNKI